MGMSPTANRLSLLPRYSKAEGWVAPQFIYDMARAFEAPGNALMGHQTTPEEAFNFAGNLAGAGIGVRTKYPASPGEVSMFAGPKAKTANMEMLRKAEQMAASGADDATVWKETGWWVNTPDGVPRFEINDINSKPGYPSWGTAEDVKQGNTSVGGRRAALLHPELSAAYPDTKQIGVIFDPSAGASGSYEYGGALGEMIRTGASRENGRANRSTMLHELQHAVQRREGMAPGGDPSREFGGVSPDLKAAIEAANDALLQLGAKGDDLLDVQSLSQVNDPAEHIFQTYQDIARSLNLTDRQADKILGPLTKKAFDGDGVLSPFESYQRLAGEAEARAVQARQNFTQQMRRNTPPWQSYDIPINKLIVRRD
jgi:hypothetical protein